jgi:tRNA threonylcarbamoyladenosine biosynthesis protein TsaB
VVRSICIDSSTSVLGVAAADSGSIVHLIEEDGAFRHVEEIVPRIDALLRECDWPAGSIDLIGVAAGPGSFTGLRIGTAAAKALSLAWDAPVAYVDTLEAFAATEAVLRDENRANAPIPGPDPTWIVPVLDARKGRYYTAVFSRDKDGLPVRLSPDADLTPEEFAQLLSGKGLRPRSWCAPGPLASAIAPRFDGLVAIANGGSAVRGVALQGWRESDQTATGDGAGAGAGDGADAGDGDGDEYRGPFYLRTGDIGIRKSAPRFDEG